MSPIAKKVMTGFAALVFFAGTVQAQDSINIVSTAVPFLRISPDARAGGMGDLAIATSPDANAPFYNLAKVPFAKKNAAIALNYTPWLKDLGLTDVYLASLAAYYKLSDQDAISTSLRFFSLGNIQLTDYSGNILNTVKPSEFSIDAGYSRVINSKLSIGVALRYINSRLVVGDVGTGVVYKAGTSVAGDVSLYYNGLDDQGSGLAWGAVLSNLGAKIGYTNDSRNKDYIPANLGIGATYTSAINESNKITFGLDVNKLLVPTAPSATGTYSVDSARLAEYRSTSLISSWFKSFSDGTNQLNSLTASLGAEYAYNEQFFVRAGYFYENKNRGNRKFFSVGAGFNMDQLNINFSYLVPSGSGVTRNPLSNTLRFGIVFNLGGASESGGVGSK
ncbi:type IX secretion system outer membrane channel protein PorV [Sediminibacterium roseum]|uniref:Type IX secretion system outer membrane channel protein PorV n=1 Tax=Sediminibacterium roseum TaxID=1978412 RepID=A0ABW9ZTD7_9BACT|nr:type IX secretion system outer membrane channel protein PorV [Sediminibacterium roseum]NCI49017.1 type IX secretion system outer membrane channel protein PorV [Sediminibacterium roseum]